MKSANNREKELHRMLELLNDTCNLLAVEVRRQQVEITRLRRRTQRESGPGGPMAKKNRVN